jgi:hypothetical protein
MTKISLKIPRIFGTLVLRYPWILGLLGVRNPGFTVPLNLRDPGFMVLWFYGFSGGGGWGRGILLGVRVGTDSKNLFIGQYDKLFEEYWLSPISYLSPYRG